MIMDRYESLKRKLQNREKVNGGMVISLTDPLLLACYDQPNVDFVLFDMEHGCFDTESLSPMLRECRRMGLPTIVRVQDALYHLIAKTIDLGADGIMLPRTETVEQIKLAVDAMHFAPIGRTGMGGWGILRPGETFSDFQQNRFLIPQIESPKGLAAMPEMLEQYGAYIHGFIVGPYDFSIMVGTPLDIYGDKVTENVQAVLKVCQTYQKSFGVYCDDVAAARRYRAMGANLFWTGDIVKYLTDGIRLTMDGLAAME